MINMLNLKNKKNKKHTKKNKLTSSLAKVNETGVLIGWGSSGST